MRKDYLARKMEELAEEQDWTDLVKVSARRSPWRGGPPRLLRLWGLFDYLAFDEDGAVIGMRVHVIAESWHKSIPQERVETEIERRKQRHSRNMMSKLEESPWLRQQDACLVCWTKTGTSEIGQPAWVPDVRWLP